MDIDAGNELVNRIKKLNPSIGGFSGLYPFGDSYLVAGTDGVGTKLKLAFDMDKHDTVTWLSRAFGAFPSCPLLPISLLDILSDIFLSCPLPCSPPPLPADLTNARAL